MGVAKKKYKVAVAGCGAKSNVWLDYAAQREDTMIVALVDTKRRRMSKRSAVDWRYPPIKQWSSIDEIYTENLIRIFQGKISVKDGLTEEATKIDKLLKS